MPPVIRILHRNLTVAVLLASWMPPSAFAAPEMRAADAIVTFHAPGDCAVALTLEVAGVDEVEHRLEVLDGAHVELQEVQGARPAGAATDIGRTKSLRLVPTSPGGAYTLRYRVAQAASHPYRCPMWLPTAPAGGRSRVVRITVSIPGGTAPAATMPAFTWAGGRGGAVLGHLPSVVIVPFVAAGQARPWDITRTMDATALATLVAASGLWLRRRRGSW